MTTYSLYIHDDRYSVPTLDFVNAMDDTQAVEVAQARLKTSPHYSAIEIWLNDRFICTLKA